MPCSICQMSSQVNLWYSIFCRERDDVSCEIDDHQGTPGRLPRFDTVDFDRTSHRDLRHFAALGGHDHVCEVLSEAQQSLKTRESQKLLKTSC